MNLDKSSDEEQVRERIFVGREPQIMQLREGHKHASLGHGALFTVAGEPGVGKTRLAKEFAVRAAARGAEVLWGRCWKNKQVPAYWPWVQLIRACARYSESEGLTLAAKSNGRDIAPLTLEKRQWLRRLAEKPDSIMSSASVAAASFPLLDSVTTFLKNVAAVRPLVLILDDLHLADPSSLVLLQFLARQLGSSRILVVGIYRNVGLRHYQQFVQFLEESAPERHNIFLYGLTEAEIARYIESLTGRLPPEKLLSTICHETGGNPFFIEELTHSFADEGRLGKPEPDRRSATFKVPEPVRDGVRQRLALLTADAMGALRMASVIGCEFDFGLLQCVSALPQDKLLASLTEKRLG